MRVSTPGTRSTCSIGADPAGVSFGWSREPELSEERAGERWRLPRVQAYRCGTGSIHLSGGEQQKEAFFFAVAPSGLFGMSILSLAYAGESIRRSDHADGAPIPQSVPYEECRLTSS
jgi:hypothetical protein